ncbi:uncharacterized protein V6R79_020455 [Siganus canaliculatus]
MDQDSYLNPGGEEEPAVLIGRALLRFPNVVIAVVSRIRQTVIQSLVVFSLVFLLLWIAAFLYGSFYYSYMPKAAFSAPVHYYYRTDCESPTSFSCSYPVANISLMRNRKHVLTFGQAYRISLQLEMPDSPANQEQGMFLIKAACFSREGGQVASSARTGMLRYRSDMLKYLGTLLFLPAFLTGAAEQKQTLEVELFSDYTDDPYSPSDSAIIEILSNRIQIYSSHLYIHAHFTGLRYLLFNFPLLSALVGVSSNFVFLGLLFIFSYMRQLLKLEWLSEQPSSDGLLSERENHMSDNQQEDERSAAADGAELLGPVQTPDADWSQQRLLSGDDTEQHNSEFHRQSEMSESEAA